MRSALFTISFLLLASLTALSQIVTVPIPHEPATTKTTLRTGALTAMKLPFWDDFSFSKTSFPHDTL
ncbi:MAG TPA: hypothetical protein VFE57_10200, partial [Cyclobacteriaceae bacterium]|nr:hypothetical protein [Cyclobacteriaceae bacterium]